MKRLVVVGLLAFAGCSSKPSSIQAHKPLPPGTVVAADSMPVTEDELNHFYFSVAIKANEQTNDGRYDIDVAYGPNTGVSAFKMPKGCENVMPLMRQGTEAYTYIIGFKMPNDTVFHEYYSVSGSRGRIEVKPIKGYTFK
jgi:hypothetical protein